MSACIVCGNGMPDRNPHAAVLSDYLCSESCRRASDVAQKLTRPRPPLSAELKAWRAFNPIVIVKAIS